MHFGLLTLAICLAAALRVSQGATHTVSGWSQTATHSDLTVDVGDTVTFQFTEGGIVASRGYNGGQNNICTGVQFYSGSIASGSTYSVQMRATGAWKVVNKNLTESLMSIIVQDVANCPSDMIRMDQCQEDRLIQNPTCSSHNNDKTTCESTSGCYFADHSSCVVSATASGSPPCYKENSTTCSSVSGCEWQSSTSCGYNCSTLTKGACPNTVGCRWYGCVISNCSAIPSSLFGPADNNCGGQTQVCDSQVQSYGCHWHGDQSSPSNVCAKDHWRSDDNHGNNNGGGSGGSGCDSQCETPMNACQGDTNCANAISALSDHIKNTLGDDPSKCDQSCFDSFIPSGTLSAELYNNVTSCYLNCFQNGGGGCPFTTTYDNNPSKTTEFCQSLDKYCSDGSPDKDLNQCCSMVSDWCTLHPSDTGCSNSDVQNCLNGGGNGNKGGGCPFNTTYDNNPSKTTELCQSLGKYCSTESEDHDAYQCCQLANEWCDAHPNDPGCSDPDVQSCASKCLFNSYYVSNWDRVTVHNDLVVKVGDRVTFKFTDDGVVLSEEGTCRGEQINSGPIASGINYTIVARAPGTYNLGNKNFSAETPLLKLVVNGSECCPADMLEVNQCQQDRLRRNDACDKFNTDQAGCEKTDGCMFEDHSWCFALTGGDANVCKVKGNSSSCEATSGCTWKVQQSCSYNCSSLSRKECGNVDGCRWYGCVMKNCSSFTSYSAAYTQCGSTSQYTCNSQLLAYGCHWHDQSSSPPNVCAKDHWRPDDNNGDSGNSVCDTLCKTELDACKVDSLCVIAATNVSDYIKSTLGGSVLSCNETCFKQFNPPSTASLALYQKTYKCYLDCNGSPPENGVCDYTTKCPKLYQYCKNTEGCIGYLSCTGDCSKEKDQDACYKKCKSEYSSLAVDIAEALNSCGDYKCGQGRCSKIDKFNTTFPAKSTVEIDFLVPLEDATAAQLSSLFGLTLANGNHPHFTTITFVNGKIGFFKNNVFKPLIAPSGRYYISNIYLNNSVVGSVNREIWVNADGEVYACVGTGNSGGNGDGNGCPFNTTYNGDASTTTEFCQDLNYLCSDSSPQQDMESCCHKIQEWCKEHPSDLGCKNSVVQPCFEQKTCQFQNPVICDKIEDKCQDETSGDCCEAVRELCALYDDPYCKDDKWRLCINKDYCEEQCHAKMVACKASPGCNSSLEALGNFVHSELGNQILLLNSTQIAQYLPSSANDKTLYNDVVQCFLKCYKLTPELECQGSEACRPLFQLCSADTQCIKLMNCYDQCSLYTSGSTVQSCQTNCRSGISSSSASIYDAYIRCVNFKCQEGECRTQKVASIPTTDQGAYIDGDFFGTMADVNISYVRVFFKDAGLSPTSQPHKKFRVVNGRLEFVFGTVSYRVPSFSGPYYLGSIKSITDNSVIGGVNLQVMVVNDQIMTCNNGCPFSSQTSCDALGQYCTNADLVKISDKCCKAIKGVCDANPDDVGCLSDVVKPCLTPCPLKMGSQCSTKIYDICPDFQNPTAECCSEVLDHCKEYPLDNGCRTLAPLCKTHLGSTGVFDGISCPFVNCSSPFSPTNSISCQDASDDTLVALCCNYTQLYCQRLNDPGCNTTAVKEDAFHGNCNLDPLSKKELKKIVASCKLTGVTSLDATQKATFRKVLAGLISIAEEFIEILGVTETSRRRAAGVDVDYQVTTSQGNADSVAQDLAQVVDNGDLTSSLNSTNDFTGLSSIDQGAPVVTEASTASSAHTFGVTLSLLIVGLLATFLVY